MVESGATSVRLEREGRRPSTFLMTTRVRERIGGRRCGVGDRFTCLRAAERLSVGAAEGSTVPRRKSGVDFVREEDIVGHDGRVECEVEDQVVSAAVLRRWSRPGGGVCCAAGLGALTTSEGSMPSFLRLVLSSCAHDGKATILDVDCPARLQPRGWSRGPCTPSPPLQPEPMPRTHETTPGGSARRLSRPLNKSPHPRPRR